MKHHQLADSMGGRLTCKNLLQWFQYFGFNLGDSA